MTHFRFNPGKTSHVGRVPSKMYTTSVARLKVIG